jgi:ketosteroid isomerase-like protein
MTQQSSVIEADKEFFDALLEANHATLDRLLVEDFVIVDVMSGGENNKSALLDALRSGRLKFLAIKPADTRLRVYGNTAVVNGRTLMMMSFDNAPVTVKSRYTHVYVVVADRWQMVAAQGTPIVE